MNFGFCSPFEGTHPPFPPSSKIKRNKDFWFREKNISFTLGFFSIKIESCKSIRKKLPSGPLSRHLRSNQTPHDYVKSTSHSYSLPAKSLGWCNWFRSIHSALTFTAHIFRVLQLPDQPSDYPVVTSHSLVQWIRWIYNVKKRMLGNEKQSCWLLHSRIMELRNLKILKIL